MHQSYKEIASKCSMARQRSDWNSVNSCPMAPFAAFSLGFPSRCYEVSRRWAVPFVHESHNAPAIRDLLSINIISTMLGRGISKCRHTLELKSFLAFPNPLQAPSRLRNKVDFSNFCVAMASKSSHLERTAAEPRGRVSERSLTVLSCIECLPSHVFDANTMDEP